MAFLQSQDRFLELFLCNQMQPTERSFPYKMFCHLLVNIFKLLKNNKSSMLQRFIVIYVRVLEGNINLLFEANEKLLMPLALDNSVP